MASTPLAFSIHNFISSVGADAGFAAIIGLAILVLLYFAHARETANLREEAALLTQRLMQAEARVAQLTRAQAASGSAQTAQDPGAPAQVVQPAASAAGVPLLPFAPAGVGAPALAAATRVVPVSLAAAAQPAAATAAAVAQPAPTPEPAEEEAPPSPATVPSPSQPETFEHDRPVAAPVTATAAATVAGANGAGHDDGGPAVPAPTGTALPPPRTPPRPDGPAARGSLPPLPPLGEPPPRRSRLGAVVAVLVGVALIGAVAAVLLIATSGGTTSSSSVAARTTNAPSASRARTAPPFLPSSVTVAVLNGTNVNQLAHHVAAKLGTDGYKHGNLLTASNQSETTTVVAYFPGAANRTAALHVANALNLKPSAVRPIDPSTKQVACPGTTSACANVVVTVGADLSTL